MNLGRLTSIKPRDIWKDEAHDFTPWLALEENIALLGETIGIELEVEATERNVGPFKADILCKDTADDHYVLIENQLEKTDHTHMGQLITYAAGLHAVTIVWIANPFRDEHRAALDWLNEVTEDNIRFFGLEVEVWQIGESQRAPKFNIISKPNDWSKSSVSSVRGDGASDHKLQQMAFWERLGNEFESSAYRVRGQKPSPKHWNNYPLGRSDFGMSASLNSREMFIRAAVTCRREDFEAHFHLLYEIRDDIEAEFGESLEWEDLPGKKVKRIATYLRNSDPTDESQWPEQMKWLMERLHRLDQVFRPRLKVLNADDFDDENVEIG